MGTNIANFVSGAAQQIVNFFTVTLPAGIQSAIAFVQQLPEKIATFFSQIPYNVGYFLGMALGTLSSWAVQLPGIAAQAASTFLSNAVSFFSQLPGQIKNWLTSALNNVSNWAVQLGQKAIQAAKTLVSNVVNGVQELPGKLLSVGKMAVEGLWNGIVGAGRWLKDQILPPGDYPQRCALLQSAILLPEQRRRSIPAPTGERRQFYLYLSDAQQRSQHATHHSHLLLQKSADFISLEVVDRAEHLERRQHRHRGALRR